ncbi:MAG: hypothetical protein GYB66_13485 [Chloroflexi bacterium]|nr:hypothetical protein [Chloroflexota bacterium]
MDVKVEHKDGHIAELTVTVDDEVINKGKRKAAKRLAGEMRIPGFRPGKAPYNVVAGLVGEVTLTQEAIEEVGNDIYRQALDESGIEPYTQAEISDVNIDDGIKITFSVPKSPDVNLGDYRSLRLDYSVKDVTEEQVEKSLARTVESLALREQVDRPPKMGDEVVMNIRGVFAEAEETAEDSDDEENGDASSEDAEDSHDHEHKHDHEEQPRIFMDERQYSYILLPDPDRDMLPGFSEALVGITPFQATSFSSRFPDDHEDEDVAGKRVDFEATITSVNRLVYPEQDDFMAQLASDNELENMEQLRERLRKNLEEIFEKDADDAYADEALAALIDLATISYPEAIVDDYIDDIIEEMDGYLREQAGLSLEDYLRYTNRSRDAVREEQRDQAITRMKKSLVLTELAKEEELLVRDGEIQAEIANQVARFGGDQADLFMRVLDSPEYRNQVAMQLVSQRTVQRLIDIAKGKEPPKGPDATTDSEDPSPGQEEDAAEGSVANLEGQPSENDSATVTPTES